MPRSPLSLRIKIAYGLPAFALAIIGIPVYVYIPKLYTDVVGIDIALVGALLFGVRIFDAFTDPVMGMLSDRTNSRFGRRRPYILTGSLLLAASLVLLFNPPDHPAPAALWFGASMYSLFLFWTVVTVPYESLGPEISFDYDERTSLFAWRDGMLIAGTLAAAASPGLIRVLVGADGGAQGEREVFFWISVLYAPLMVLFCLGCVREVQEDVQGRGPAGGWGGWGEWRTILANRPFVILLSAYTISAIGSNLPATLILYYVEYVLGSSLADLFLLLYFIAGILFLPGWVWLARRFGKLRTWLASMLLNTGAFFLVFFLGQGDQWLYAVLVVLSGMGFGATLALPSAIQADVLDYDELLSGKRREGLYIGIWSIAKKMAAAVGVGAGLALLGSQGYTPNVEQPAGVVMTLRVLYALVPCLCNVAAIALALQYPINAAKHLAIREGIALRRKGTGVEDPLQPGRWLGGM